MSDPIVLFVDAGTTSSGVAIYSHNKVHYAAEAVDNEELLDSVREGAWSSFYEVTHFAAEDIVLYGNRKAGLTTIGTAKFLGRLYQEFRRKRDGFDLELISRPKVLLHVTGMAQEKKNLAWQHMIQRFGPPGTKREPGILFGVRDHARDALEGAVCIHDQVVGRSFIS